jgi:hypothetical protein
MFYAAPQGPTPEQLKEKFLVGLRPLLQPSSFSGAGAVAKLTSHIKNYGITKVDVATRLDILTKIRDNAGNHYFRAWAENDLAMDITKKWLIESVSDSDISFPTTTMPLLHVRVETDLPIAYRGCHGMPSSQAEITDFRSATNDYRVSERLRNWQGCEARLKVNIFKFW